VAAGWPEVDSILPPFVFDVSDLMEKSASKASG